MIHFNGKHVLQNFPWGKQTPTSHIAYVLIRMAVYSCCLADQKAELEAATSQLKGMIEDTKENIATEVLEQVQFVGMYSCW